MEITKNNPHGSPLLGQPVDVKDYTSTIVTNTQTSATQPAQKPNNTVNNPPPVKEETSQTAEPVKNTSGEAAAPPPPPPPDDTESFGTDYADDGIDDYTALGADASEFEEPGENPVNLADIDTDLLTDIAVTNFSQYVPSLFVGLSERIAHIRKRDIVFHAEAGNIPREYLELFNKDREELKQALQLTDDEARLLSKALKAYLDTQSINAATPGNALMIQATLITLRLTITSIQTGIEQRKRWEMVFRKNDIQNPRKHSYEIKVKDED